jgi:hypothetical protein
VTPSLAVPPLFAALAPARSILIAGAGGGFDVYAGLPLARFRTEAGTGQIQPLPRAVRAASWRFAAPVLAMAADR